MGIWAAYQKDFADVPANEVFGVRGVFNEGGGAAIDQVKTTIQLRDTMTDRRGDARKHPPGACFEFMCHNCQRQNQVLIEFPELIALSHQIPPQVAYQAGQQMLPRGGALAASLLEGPVTHWKWAPEHGEWALSQRCANGGCNWNQPLRVAPKEIQGLIQAGRRRQQASGQDPWLQRAQLANAHCQGVANAARQRR